jgi:hypothetical protein
MNTPEQAHRRLLNAVITYIGADQSGSQQEIRDAVAELHAAKDESQKLLYPPLQQAPSQGRRR